MSDMIQEWPKVSYILEYASAPILVYFGQLEGAARLDYHFQGLCNE